MEFINGFVINKNLEEFNVNRYNIHNLSINYIYFECGNLQNNFQFIKVCLITKYHKIIKIYMLRLYFYACILEMYIID